MRWIPFASFTIARVHDFTRNKELNFTSCPTWVRFTPRFFCAADRPCGQTVRAADRPCGQTATADRPCRQTATADRDGGPRWRTARLTARAEEAENNSEQGPALWGEGCVTTPFYSRKKREYRARRQEQGHHLICIKRLAPVIRLLVCAGRLLAGICVRVQAKDKPGIWF